MFVTMKDDVKRDKLDYGRQ
ncbi:hypothetical protein A2U01_0074371, partial [Trifolium medium]|nr:hypothetical protein [Trifolium medium]